jgi:hypothetical protein
VCTSHYRCHDTQFNFFKYPSDWESDVKFVECIDIYIFHIMYHCFVLCDLLWKMNKAGFQHKVKYLYI